MSTQEIADRLARERERQAGRKAYLIARQRCYRCGTQDAFTLNGRTRCAECVEKGRLQAEKDRPRYQAQMNASKKALYHRRKNDGLCPQCGRPRDGATVYCKTCAAFRRDKERKKRWASVKCTAASRGENSPDESSDQGKGSSSRRDDPQETV